MTEQIKHKILSELSKIYINRTYSGTNYSEQGKSLSTEELNIKTKIKLDDLNTILKSLCYNDYIKPVCLQGSNSTFYLITDKGFDALSDKRFLWYYPSTDKISIILSVIALLVSIFKN